MAIYNTTNLTSAKNFLEFTQAINTASESYFGIMLYISILLILFITLKIRTQARMQVILATTSWFGLIFAVLLRVLQLIPAYFILLAMLAGIISLGLLFVPKSQED